MKHAYIMSKKYSNDKKKLSENSREGINNEPITVVSGDTDVISNIDKLHSPLEISWKNKLKYLFWDLVCKITYRADDEENIIEKNN